MKRLECGLVVAALALAGCTAHMKQDEEEMPRKPAPELKVNAIAEIEGALLVDGDEIPLSGRASFQLTASQEELKAGRVGVRRFNVVLFGVPQARLTGVEPRGRERGVLGFALAASAKRQALEYDPETGEMRGSLSGLIDFPQLAEYPDPKRDPERDYETTPAVLATLGVRIGMKQPFALRETEEPLGAEAQVELELASGDLTAPVVLPQLDLSRFKIRVIDLFELEYIFHQFFRFTERLCLQPVGIRTGPDDPDPTGDGLDFGRPQMRTQWGKVDVTFEIRDWMFVDEADYKVLTPAEREELLPLVAEDDCIEVYFAQEFVPQDKWGGGVTRGGGRASSTITSSDQNADFGIDEAHLAHEVGHVLGLAHPGDGDIGPIMIDGSSGTVICPSGFQNDNPHVNSEENGELLQNPLLESVLANLSVRPDCEDGADCGDCP